MIKRLNTRGIEYNLIDSNNKTIIKLNDRSITVNFKIEKILFDWYRWNNGVLIQEAFSYLNTDEREFLISRLTTEEWDEIFPSETIN